MEYIITVKMICTHDQLDWDDRADLDLILGEHRYIADSEDEALDEFHSTIPIACLDDFEITCEEGDANSKRFIEEN